MLINAEFKQLMRANGIVSETTVEQVMTGSGRYPMAGIFHAGGETFSTERRCAGRSRLAAED